MESEPATEPEADAIVQLAIESIGRSASLAILRGDTVLRCYQLDDRTRTAATLAPGIKQALDDCSSMGWEVSLVSVADGPGSFTGLRIGVTTAKTLAYARELALVGVDSVAAVAATVFTRHVPIRTLSVVLDAYRGQAFTGRFERESLLPDLQQLLPTWSAHPTCVDVLDGAELDEFFASAGNESPFAGDQKALDGRVAASRRVEREGLSGSEPTVVDAVGVGRLAIRSYLLGQTVSPMELVPRYLRPSAAEEKLAPRAAR